MKRERREGRMERGRKRVEKRNRERQRKKQGMNKTEKFVLGIVDHLCDPTSQKAKARESLGIRGSRPC